MKKKILYLLIVSLCVFSCDSKKSEVIQINMSIEGDSKSFCDLIDVNKFIKLETSKESLIGTINKVKIVKDKIFIHDIKTQSIVIFSYPKGRFISKINSIGNGPGEFLNIDSFDVNVKEKYIEILDTNLKKVFKYDFDGGFINYKNIPFYANSFSYINDSEYLFTKLSSIVNNEFDYEILLANDRMKLTNKLLKLENSTSIGVAQGNQISKLDDGSVLYLQNNSTTAYKINQGKIVPKYYFDFGNNWNEKIFYSKFNNPQDLVKILNKKKIIYSLGVTDNNAFLLIDFWLTGRHYLALYNKKSENITYIKKNENGLEHRMFIKGLYKDAFISVKEPIALLNMINSNRDFCLGIDEKKVLNTLKEDDNPVLMLTKFKE